MRALALAAILLAAPTSAWAHHKPSHGMPPGQMKFDAEAEGHLPTATELFSVTVEELPDALGWRRYVDADYRFELDVPSAIFAAVPSQDRGLRLDEIGGEGQLQIYGADNTRGLSPREFVTALEEADRIAEVTYRTEGRSWFVLSGYYADRDSFGEPLIFYAKFMFSADRSRVSAFEISYPARDKQRFYGIVEHMEDSFTSPQ